MGNLQAADKALQLLRAFGEGTVELTVNRIARRLKVHKSTASRLAATLRGRGFLERVPGSRAFRLGPEMGRLGLLAWGGRDVVEASRDPMARLAAAGRETVNLAFLDGSEAINVVQVDGPHVVGIGSWEGRRNPLHGAANGKIFLAFAGADPGPAPYPAFTRRTITRAGRLRAELRRVRRRGWAAAVGELEEGLNAVAAPVIDALGRCRAALSVAGPAYRIPPRRLRSLARLCRAAAHTISARLGADDHAS
jgi:DNA-binding IclR family transcriptional regulator